MDKHGRAAEYLKRQLTRRQALRAGGLTALGLVFSKPIIETIRPLPAFAQYAPSPTPTPTPSPTPTPTATPTPTLTGRILISCGGFPGGIFFCAFEPATGNIQQITVNGSVSGEFPAWSADGSKFSYLEPLSGLGREVVIANEDGSGRFPLPGSDRANDLSKHSWSPDGSKIAVSRQISGGTSGGIFLVNVDGSGSSGINLGGDAFDPDWSPDGTKIAFRSRRTGEDRIFVANVNGSGVTQLTNLSGSNQWPDWSPDGTKLVFTRERSNDREIYIVDADGSNLGLLALHISPSQSTAAWSPDGSAVAYSCRVPQGNNQVNGVCILNLGTGSVQSHIIPGGSTRIDWGL